MRRWGVWLVLAVGIALGVVLAARAADPSKLWHIVHDRCVPDMQQKHEPAPCTIVDLAGGYTVLKDIVGATQYLLIPTARVSGIEDPALLAPDSPNYWQPAWDARSLVEQRAGRALPRDALSLAINSSVGRTQDQLHIHIDCVRADVRASLIEHADEIGPQWKAFPAQLAGHTYRALRLDGAEFGARDPFRLLSDTVPAEEMRWHTLVAVGMTFGAQPGFVLLDDHADLLAGDRASGEELQDHACAVLR
jgi:CDP-diacylglycerol pyrophosphatase